jgi:pheromone shutdown protein TraB
VQLLLGQEYVQAIRLAADADVRVVLGDRDLVTTVARYRTGDRYSGTG